MTSKEELQENISKLRMELVSERRELERTRNEVTKLMKVNLNLQTEHLMFLRSIVLTREARILKKEDEDGNEMEVLSCYKGEAPGYPYPQ